jgi:hypothetical protein
LRVTGTMRSLSSLIIAPHLRRMLRARRAFGALLRGKAAPAKSARVASVVSAIGTGCSNARSRDRKPAEGSIDLSRDCAQPLVEDRIRRR